MTDPITFPRDDGSPLTLSRGCPVHATTLPCGCEHAQLVREADEADAAAQALADALERARAVRHG